MDPTLDFLWREQLVPLSAFFNDDFDDGTITFNRIIHGNDSACSRILLSPLSLHGRQLNDLPIMFHITGLLCQEKCSLTSDQTPGTHEETVRIKLCFQELPDSVSRIEWGQCEVALRALEMLGQKDLWQAVRTEDAFYRDEASGKLRLILQGLQLNHSMQGSAVRQILHPKKALLILRPAGQYTPRLVV